MKTVCKTNQCAGCMACVDACPTQSIAIIDEQEYFNAHIDPNTCIKCGLCHKICQYNHPAKSFEPIIWKEGWANEKIRSSSSSGGFGQELIRSFILNNGDVAACRFSNGEFIFEIFNSIDELQHYIGSKYVKSDPSGIYKKVLERLNNGRRVLFIGLPCQVSAIRNFIPQNHQENLYTVDLICHGSPSKSLLCKCVQEYGLNIKSAKSISFRNNTKFGLVLDGKRILPNGVTDKYTLAFLRGIIYTENCYSCHYAQKERVGDLTLGDSWGTDNHTELDRGISLILCQTQKGMELLKIVNFYMMDANIDNSIKNNQQLSHPTVMSEKRKTFFKEFKRSKNFNHSVKKAFPKDCMKQSLKEKMINIGIIKASDKI